MLAYMLNEDEDALICDMAETYHIFDMWALPIDMLAVLASGLRDSSRIKMKLRGEEQSFNTLLLAGCLDRLSMLLWAKTEDAQKGINRPESVLDKLIGSETSANNSKAVTFISSDEFMKEWDRLSGGNNGI